MLRRDPAGVYGAMDFLSRDRQRQAVEELAAPTGEAQVGVALRALESARQAAEAGSMSDRAAHVGYHLVGEGRRDLEADIGYRPRAAKRVKRLVLGAPAAFYLGSVGLVTALLVGLGAAYAHRQAEMPGPWFWVGLIALLAVPASDVAITLIQRLVALLIPPQRLQRLEFTGDLPPDARTMVIVPSCSRPSPTSKICSNGWRWRRSRTWIPAFISRSSATSWTRPSARCRRMPRCSRPRAPASRR